MADDKAELIELTAHIVANFLTNNKTAVADLPALIRVTHDALAGVGFPELEIADTIAKPTAGAIRKSITPDALISFVDGKAYKTLKRHLRTHGMTVDEYKSAYGLPRDYPTTAPAYSEARSAMAKSLGLGQGGRRTKALAKAPAKAPRAKKS